MSSKPLKYWEHCDKKTIDQTNELRKEYYTSMFPKRKGEDMACYTLRQDNEGIYKLSTGYFIGVDWLDVGETALYIAPKLNKTNNTDEKIYEVDFIKMLFDSLKHSDVSKEIDELFIVKWDEPAIEIEQKNDILTPFLVIEFLSVLKSIVRMGLKKSYYPIEKNLNSRVKGKILISKNIKKNLTQNKQLYTYCSFEEFGVNNKENRLLKKALVFIKRFLPNYSKITNSEYLQNIFNFVNPAFQDVSDKIELTEIKHTKTNVFYKEYAYALRLAKIILKRFGYNISNIEKQKILTPPFWIDMSKLFELYVLALLKDRFHNQVRYHFTSRGNEMDFILKSDEYQLVIDAKYKPKYIKVDGLVHNDIRQVSGYARLKKVYEYLDKEYPESIDCLIFYPDPDSNNDDIINLDLKDKSHIIEQYEGVYKIGVSLPTIN